jgi:hypothetical protein
MTYKAPHVAAVEAAYVKILGVPVPNQQEGLKVLRIALKHYQAALFADPQVQKDVAEAIWISMRESRRLSGQRRFDKAADAALKVIQHMAWSKFPTLAGAATPPGSDE